MPEQREEVVLRARGRAGAPRAPARAAAAPRRRARVELDGAAQVALGARGARGARGGPAELAEPALVAGRDRGEVLERADRRVLVAGVEVRAAARSRHGSCVGLLARRRECLLEPDRAPVRERRLLVPPPRDRRSGRGGRAPPTRPGPTGASSSARRASASAWSNCPDSASASASDTRSSGVSLVVGDREPEVLDRLRRVARARSPGGPPGSGRWRGRRPTAPRRRRRASRIASGSTWRRGRRGGARRHEGGQDGDRGAEHRSPGARRLPDEHSGEGAALQSNAPPRRLPRACRAPRCVFAAARRRAASRGLGAAAAGRRPDAAPRPRERAVAGGVATAAAHPAAASRACHRVGATATSGTSARSRSARAAHRTCRRPSGASGVHDEHVRLEPRGGGARREPRGGLLDRVPRRRELADRPLARRARARRRRAPCGASGAAPDSSAGSGIPCRSMNAARSSRAIRRCPPGVRCALSRRALIQFTTVGSETPSSRAASKVV